MSFYTITIRELCEEYTGLHGINIDEIINRSRKFFFNFDYPIFSTSYREHLEKHFLKHFYFREIGQETVGLFIAYLNIAFNDLLPYYNQLYKSELLNFNPFETEKIVRSLEKKGVENSEYSNERNTKNTIKNENTINTTSIENNQNKRFFSDTPQGELTAVDSGKYLTDYTKTENTNNIANNQNENGKNTNKLSENINTTGETNNSENISEKITAIHGNQSEMLLKYRETFLNIDLDLFSKLEYLFCGLLN